MTWFDKSRLIPILIGTESGLTTNGSKPFVLSSDQRSRVSKKSDLSKDATRLPAGCPWRKF
jgi:hypothetical protein